MVEEAARLVVGDDQEAAVPLRLAGQRGVGGGEERLPPDRVMRRMVVVDECSGGGPTARGLTELEELADSGFFAPGLDRRSEARDILHGIGDALERLNAGRIRRGR